MIFFAEIIFVEWYSYNNKHLSLLNASYLLNALAWTHKSRIVAKLIAFSVVMLLCYVWVLGLVALTEQNTFCMIAIADRVLTKHDLTTVGECQIFKGARKYAMKYHTFRTRHVQATYALMVVKIASIIK